MRTGGEGLQQEFNRGYDFILNTYGAAENIMPGKNAQIILIKGIVIDIDFQVDKNYKLAESQPPFSIYAKIIGEDLDVEHPDLAVQKIYYSPLLPIHNISIPEIGEEILIMRESTNISSRGYYVGRVGNTSTLNYYPVRNYMDSMEEGVTSPEFKYGFSFDVNDLRNRRQYDTPSDEIDLFSIPLTFGDVVQQGRSQTYIRHSFNRVNKKGVLEQGIRGTEQPAATPLPANIIDPQGNGESVTDPSIGVTDTKNIHLIDNSIMSMGDYPLASTLPNNPNQNNTLGPDKSMIVNIADELYNISSNQTDTTMYRQVLGEKLINQQAQTNSLIKTMLDGLTGLTETVQVLLDAFIDHEHALPKIELNLEKSITSSDRYVVPARYQQQPPQKITVPARRVRVRTGFNKETRRAIYSYVGIPGFQREVERPPKLVQPARTRIRKRSQKINFEAIIGGEEDPRFTAPIETDSGDVENPAPLGLKTQKVNNDTEELIDLFNDQKEKLNTIFNRATDFLSKNQFIN